MRVAVRLTEALLITRCDRIECKWRVGISDGRQWQQGVLTVLAWRVLDRHRKAGAESSWPL